MVGCLPRTRMTWVQFSAPHKPGSGSALERRKQENWGLRTSLATCKLEASLGYIRPCLKRKEKKKDDTRNAQKEEAGHPQAKERAWKKRTLSTT